VHYWWYCAKEHVKEKFRGDRENMVVLLLLTGSAWNTTAFCGAARGVFAVVAVLGLQVYVDL